MTFSISFIKVLAKCFFLSLPTSRLSTNLGQGHEEDRTHFLSFCRSFSCREAVVEQARGMFGVRHFLSGLLFTAGEYLVCTHIFLLEAAYGQ